MQLDTSRDASLESLLAGQPAVLEASADVVAEGVRRSGRVLIVLDDDPTGTQAVAGLPVLTAWHETDLGWALDTGAPAVYVVTNTRSLDAVAAERINREVVRAALLAAAPRGVELGWVSRGDSTLRGHFPLEPAAIAAELVAAGEPRPAGTVVVPAFPEAHRVTIDGVHYTRENGRWVPVGESEFARDATFGYRASRLVDWVAEKTAAAATRGGAVAAPVIELRLRTLRAGAEAVAEALRAAPPGAVIVADAVVEHDMRQLALGLEIVEAEGQSFMYRVGPPFVRARIGQAPSAPVAPRHAKPPAREGGGITVVGSHTALTTRQLDVLLRERPRATVVELDVPALIGEGGAGPAIRTAAQRCRAALASGDVILQTSRELVRAAGPEQSLAISRAVSDAIVEVMREIIARTTPAYVIAKGGITSSDVATRGLEIRRAEVAGSLFPGLVSVWLAASGPAAGVPYVVFPGNVGSDTHLAEAVAKLSGDVAAGSHEAPTPTSSPTSTLGREA
ncbi:four-carbon acid sugar kinase family protein [Leucobacter albus]|uniref:Four-carbon acid sugar kinase family protein n=1 Tax=Leucobacter albus TaxID=272210 RepID=A0ABW3TPF9_9MICO